MVVSFDPLIDVAAAASFRSRYGIDSGVTLVGPFLDGPLRNVEGSIRLQRPDQPPVGELGFYPSVTEDGVHYLASAPWPSAAAGGGDSLQRSLLAGFGNFPSSWTAATASPGGKAGDYASWRDAFFGLGAPAGSGPLDDFDRDGIVNLLEFALGLNPLLADGGPLTVLKIEGGELNLTYAKDTSLGGIIYQVERSLDLVSWTPVPDQIESLSGSVEMRKAAVGMAPNLQQFLRLVIEQQ